MESSDDRSQQLQLLIDEYVSERRNGLSISRDEFAARHPDFAEELQRELSRVELLLGVYEGSDMAQSEKSDATSQLSGTLEDDRPDELQVRCPECQTRISVRSDTPWTSISCDSCLTQFSLVGGGENKAGDGLTRIQHFELIERVGMGGFGTVWRARDTKLDRIVAIKIPRKGQLSVVEAEQFLREARSSAQMQHPNIVHVYEVGQHDDHFFIASEFIEGRTLTNQITDFRPTVRDSVVLVGKLADALQNRLARDDSITSCRATWRRFACAAWKSLRLNVSHPPHYSKTS